LSFPFSRNPFKGQDWGKFRFREKTARAYLDALIREINLSSRPGETASILLGAGDWSLVPRDYLIKIESCLKSKFPFAKSFEFTAEVSPFNIAAASAEALSQIEINRISLNLYKYPLEKIESAAALIRPLTKNINLDLYFGTPRQSLGDWKKTVRAALSCKPTHISIYSFGTTAPATGLRRQMYFLALDSLKQERYRQHDIYHFSRPGYASMQNSIHARQNDWMGFGAGAVSGWGNLRLENAGSPMGYIQNMNAGRDAVISRRILTAAEKLEEEIYFSLSRPSGVSLTVLRKEYPRRFPALEKNFIPRLVQAGYLYKSKNRIRLTKGGFFIADDLISKLIAQLS
jgi:oxygen-independent coproporphyrinogen-3 oxidase